MVYLKNLSMFEFDRIKSKKNRLKHGIDFEEAQRLWDDPNLLEAAVKGPGEARHLVIARLNEVYWTAVITYRGSNIRIISVRRSRTNEVQRYGR